MSIARGSSHLSQGEGEGEGEGSGSVSGSADEQDGLRQLRRVPGPAEVARARAVLADELQGREPLPARPPAQPYRAALRPLPEESWRLKAAG